MTRARWATGASLAVLAVASGASAQDVLRELRTAMVLRELEAARSTSRNAAGLVVSSPAPELGADSLTTQMDRMERLTQDALARSNARIRAVRPASDR